MAIQIQVVEREGETQRRGRPKKKTDTGTMFYVCVSLCIDI